jgi:hypothetical protein
VIPHNISGITLSVKRLPIGYFEALSWIFQNLTSSEKVPVEKIKKTLR